MLTIPAQRLAFSPQERMFLHAGLDTILASGILTMGRYTHEFEEAFAALAGSRQAVACSSGTSALELIFRALEIENRSVIVPTNTFSATPLAVTHAGNRVIFADSDPETLCLSVEDVERRITPDTAAIVLVHIGGIITPRIRDFQRLCERKALLLVEDCAHAHGSTFAGQGAGTFGVAAAFSFFPTKVLTAGEGGMVTTADEAIASRVRSLRNHGKEPGLANRIAHQGSNYRMSEMTALLGLQQTQSAREKIDSRRRAAAFYDAALQALPAIRPLTLPAELSSTYYKYIAYLDPAIDRRHFKDTLREDYGISSPSEVYAELCHEEPVWRQLRQAGSQEYPGAEFLSRHHLCLPMYPGLTEAELEHVARSVESALGRHATSSLCAS